MDPVAQGLAEHRETIDIMGGVKVWLRDLDEAWKKEAERAHVQVTQTDAYMTWDFDIAAPRQTVWEHFTVPGQNAAFCKSVFEQTDRRDADVGTGEIANRGY
jgi:hypothetical protein